MDSLFRRLPTGVVLTLPAGLDGLLAQLAEQGLPDSPLAAAAPGPLAVVPDGGDDLFARLEAEMVSDRLAAAQTERRDAATVFARQLFSSDATGPDGMWSAVLDEDDAQLLLEWANRAYVAGRLGELGEVVVGRGQSGLGMFDDLDDEFSDDPGLATAESSAPMRMLTLLLAAFVGDLSSTLFDAG